jgi:Xaa-Pro dipeptidase
MLFNKNRALRLMMEEGIDGVVGTCVENISYFTNYYARPFRGVKTTQYYTVFSRHHSERKAVVLPSIRLPSYVAEGFDLSELYVYGRFSVERPQTTDDHPFVKMLVEGLKADGRFENPFDALMSALKDLDLLKGTIAVDEMHCTHQQWNKLEGLLPNAKLVPGYEFIRKLRAIKTMEEIERLQKSVEVIEQAIRESLPIMRPGATERELANKLQEVIGRLGGLPGVVGLAAGARSAVLLSESDYILQRGDQIRYDVGCIHNLYWSDIGRNFCLGEPGEKQKKLHAALLEGQQTAVQSVKPGVKASDIYWKAVNTIRKAGIPNYERPHCGHGIGLEFYDPPNIRADDNTLLEEGMVFTIETPYYLVGLGGFQIEDNLVVTRNGVKLLSNLPREIIIPI